MTDDVKALIAEARSRAQDVPTPEQIGKVQIDALVARNVGVLLSRLADALESLTASLSVSERSDATVTEVTAPAIDDERHQIADAVSTAIDSMEMCECANVRIDWDVLDDAILRGRRSARVPVSRDELAENLRSIHFDGTGCGTTASTACSNCFGPSPMTAREIAEHLSTTYDIYPKADRKPSDSSNGEH